MANEDQDVARLEASLRSCRLELAAVRAEQETWAERIAPWEDSVRRFEELSTALDEHLAAGERATAGFRGWVKRRIFPEFPSPAEMDDLRRIRTSPLFDGAWYLRTYPDVVRTGLSPALHFLRHGARQRKNPGPNFDTRAYVEEHLDLPRGANPLLHYQAHVPGVAR